MPKKSNKSKVIDIIFENAMSDLMELDSSQESEEDDIHDQLLEDIEMALQCRIGYSIHVPKQHEWLNDILYIYDEGRFKQAVRMTRQNFNTVLEIIKHHRVFSTSRNQVPVSVQLAVTLYRFGIYGTGASIPAVARIFGLGDGSTVVRFTRRVIQALLSVQNTYIYWPNETERTQIVATYFDCFPRCIGFIDGTHIKLDEAPALDKESYFDKDKNYSIQVQLICDFDKKIRHFVAGYPGSVHDSRVWNDCNITVHPDVYFSDEQWICGDKGYGLNKYVITPYRENQKHLPLREARRFNKYFSKERVRIEHVNGILKEVFGSLKELRLKINSKKSHQRAVEWITACLILYNIIMPTDEVLMDSGDDDELEHDTNSDAEEEEPEDDLTAEDKRKAIYYHVKLSWG